MERNSGCLVESTTDTTKLQDFALYRFIIDSLPVGILTVSPGMKVTSFNPWAEALTGYSAKEALGRYCGDILEGGMCKLNCPLKTAIDQRQPIVRIETTLRNKRGETIPVRMHTAALLDSKGGLIGAVEAFQDISFLKVVERERENLISMFGHDMKSSLTIIGGFVLRLLKQADGVDEEKWNKYLGIIQNETDRLAFLVNDFLEFARLQKGELNFRFQTISLDKLLMELFEAYQPRAMHSGVELELLNEKILPVIKADPDRLRRVLTNLLDNAFKFSEEGGRITIAAHEADQEITIRIKDQGTGIDSKELPYIFDPYHRGIVRGKIEGFGLGLATVKTIVEGHGGHVLVESELGKGSAFTVVLPRDAKAKSAKYAMNGFRISNQSEQGKRDDGLN